MLNNGNPAQRLYDLVVKAEKIFSEARPKNKPKILWNFWAEVFEMEGVSSREAQVELISRVNQGRKLIDEVENLLLKNKEINHEKYLSPFPNLKLLFALPSKLGSSFGGGYFPLNIREITILEFGIDAVSKVYKEKVVDEDELKTLLSEIQSLYEQTIDLEIDKNLKRILLDMLKIMENAIHEYRIRGVERLREAMEQLIGIYIFNKENIENSGLEEIGKLRKILNRFGSMYSSAADTVQLLGAGEVIKNTGEFITKFLNSGQ